MSLAYRRDIDGLRGLAVLAVVIYHFSPHAMPGGFVGVDVFFVISGFLITAILKTEMERKSFSFEKFYQRRIRRILPAFYVACLGALLLGSLFLTASDFRDLGYSALSACGFVSNHYFSHRFNYFSNNVWEFPLLHTWSLSVEEQFYLFWPPLLFLTFDVLKSRPVVFYTIGVSLILLSIGLGEWLLADSRTSQIAYYLLPTRCGELLTGSLLALCEIDKRDFKTVTKNALSNLGLILLFGSFFIINGESKFPGVRAVFPCAGAAMLIASSRDSLSFASRFLTNRLMMGLGLISYSLYLWHWLVLAIGRYAIGRVNLHLDHKMVLVLITFGFSMLSWKFVEQPFRKSELSFSKTVLWLFLLPASVVSSFATFVAYSDGWPGRFSSRSDEMARDTTFLSPKFCFNEEKGDCVLAPNGKPAKVILFGDSNSGHYMPFWEEVGNANQFSIYSVSIDRCYPVLDVGNHLPSQNKSLPNSNCGPFLRKVTERVNGFDVFVLGAAWSSYLNDPQKPHFREDLEATIQFLSSRGKKVFLMEQAPVFNPEAFDHYLRAKYFIFGTKPSNELRAKLVASTAEGVPVANKVISEIAAQYPNTYFLRAVSRLRNPETMPFIDDELVFMNYGHLNEYGSRKLAKTILPQLSTELDGILRVIK